jgi:hypothetical protein
MFGYHETKPTGAYQRRPTQRAPNLGYAPRYFGFFRFAGESTSRPPALIRGLMRLVTPVVGRIRRQKGKHGNTDWKVFVLWKND